ncbi:uncharacterized protein LOC116192224 [Punica granatum]|uniref:Uncharacterized protein n=2 Tax=Punica granatum TaxID=22663 RepID=A0A218Y0Y7_PUNGR|nr:uncharacterized protein LOC116192224 [Punica granatum]OWM90943.1 hypothetical protein CDL15_Pgr019255 [Punica granatum]PKI48109.1 hypothetical protein CRG98_031471 [Punica granatum]
MAPNRETPMGSYNPVDRDCHGDTSRPKPPKLSLENLQRTISDISTELNKEKVVLDDTGKLPPISEVEDAKCECCGMSEECTPEYISRVREEFSSKLVCGLCAEAVRERIQRRGGKNREAALEEHISACQRFNRIGRAYPVLSQAEAMRKILKKRVNSMSPKGPGPKKLGGGLARSSSCIPAITQEVTDQRMVD